MSNCISSREALFTRTHARPLAASCVLLLALAGLPAYAAEAPRPAASQPSAHAAMPTSGFGMYRKWREVPTADWKQANDRVGAIGGWMTYLREAQPSDPDAGAHAPAATGHHHGH